MATDRRITGINNLIDQFLQLDFSARETVSGKGDEIDELIKKLNTLGEKFQEKKLLPGDRNKRLADLMEVMLNYTSLNFSRKALVSDAGDELDALALGLNTLAEELEDSISTEKKYTQNLQESEKKYRELIEMAPDSVIIIDKDGRIVNWNNQAENMFGWQKEEVEGKLLSQTIIPERYREQHTRGIKKYLETGIGPVLNKPIELSGLTKTNTEFPVELKISAIKINNEQFFIGFIRDITERKKAELQLKESEDRFRKLFDLAPYPMWVYDLNTLLFLEVNQAAIEHYGYTHEEFLTMHLQDIRPAEEIPRLMENAKGRWEEVQSSSGWKHRLRNGKLIDVEITSHLLDFKNHSAALVIANDITARKRSEYELKQANKFVDSIIENIPNMIFVKDAKELRFVRLNKAGEKLLGYSEKDLLGKNDYDFFRKEQADSFTKKDREVLAKKEIVDIPEEPIDTKTGKRLLHTQKITITDEKNNPLYLLGISEDITERKKIEKALRESEERFRLLVENVKDYAIISMDPTGHIISWNKGAEQIIGYKPMEIIGKDFSVFYTPENSKEGLPASNLLMAEKEGRYENIGWRVRKDGSRFWADVIYTSLYNEKGKLKGFVKITRDITAQKEAQEKISGLNDELEKAKNELELKVIQRTASLEKSNKELRDYAHIISHDLKAPLRAIGTLSDLLISDYYNDLDEEGRQKLLLIKNRILRLDKMVSGILEYSEAGQKAATVSIDLNNLVTGVIHEIDPPANITVLIKNKLPQLTFNKKSLHQVFFHLISNAVKYNDKAEGLIEIGCNEEKDQWKFYVADNGPGIPKEFQEKIFNIFQTLTPRDQVEGTGLGLAIVKKIVEQKKGKVWVESTGSNGSTFFFTLPKY